MGDAAIAYIQTVDLKTVRNPHIPNILVPDELHPVPGLSSTDIKTLCSTKRV